MADRNSSSFQPIANPYIVGNPIEDRKMFFGREDDFEYIRKKIVGGKKGGLLILCGTRRSGKTSILFQIKGGRLGEEFVPILIDMQSMTVQDDGEFLAKLAFEIIRAIDHADISYKSDYLAAAAQNPFNAFQTLIQVIKTKLPDRKLVLMFDEYELFETHVEKGRFSTDILHLLASWMEHSTGVFIVFTGSDKLESRQKTYWEHFLGKALHRRISFLSRGDTFRLANEPVSGVVTYGEGVVEEIFHLTAGQPFYTQVLCQSLVDHLNEQRKTTIEAEDVRSVVAELIENPLPQMIFNWGSLPDVEKLCLSCLAELNKEEPRPLALDAVCSFPVDQGTGFRFDSQKLYEAGERLFQHDILAKEADGERFTFKMDLWRQWVGRMHSIWQVIDEITEGGRRVGEGVRKDEPRKYVPWLVVAGALIVAVFLGFHFLGPQDEIGPADRLSVAIVPPDSAWVSIETEPTGATVHLGERFLGRTPMQARRVLAGVHFLRLELADHRVLGDTLDLARDDTLRRGFQLAEITGDLRILSTPAGAGITLDGRQLDAVTPHTVRGMGVIEHHRIVLTLAGYHGATIPNIIVQGDTVITVSRNLGRITFPLTVRSRPDTALVIWDSMEVGTTLYNFGAVAEGEHDLIVRKAGYQDWSRTINIPAPNNLIQAELDPLPPGKLVFLIANYADIRINGELYASGVPNWSGEFPPGTYRIELDNNPSYAPLTRTIVLESGVADTTTYQFDESEAER